MLHSEFLKKMAEKPSLGDDTTLQEQSSAPGQVPSADDPTAAHHKTTAAADGPGPVVVHLGDAGVMAPSADAGASGAGRARRRSAQVPSSALSSSGLSEAGSSSASRPLARTDSGVSEAGPASASGLSARPVRSRKAAKIYDARPAPSPVLLLKQHKVTLMKEAVDSAIKHGDIDLAAVCVASLSPLRDTEACSTDPAAYAPAGCEGRRYAHQATLARVDRLTVAAHPSEIPLR